MDFTGAIFVDGLTRGKPSYKMTSRSRGMCTGSTFI